MQVGGAGTMRGVQQSAPCRTYKDKNKGSEATAAGSSRQAPGRQDGMKVGGAGTMRGEQRDLEATTLQPIHPQLCVATKVNHVNKACRMLNRIKQ
jgi:hypothetical protein